MIMAKDIAQALAARAEEVARYLLPAGKLENHEWKIGSVEGEPGKSMGVRLTGSKAGVWCDFADKKSGDLLDLWAIVRSLSLKDAIIEAKEYLGIPQGQLIRPEAFKEKSFKRPANTKATKLAPHSPVRNYLINERKLTNETLEAFKMGEYERTIVFPYLRDGVLIQMKYLSIDRPDGKKKMWTEANCEPCLFGWDALDPKTRTITLCEGEIDAMSLHQYGFQSMSLPFGGGGGAKQSWIEYDFERLNVFDKIYLCLDNDEQGKMAMHELVDRLGRHRCMFVELPHKDANACLQAGVTTEQIQECFKRALNLDPIELKQGCTHVENVIAKFYPTNDIEKGIILPWERARGKLLLRPSELTILTGINGHGKSQFVGHMLLEAMSQDLKVCIASLELKPDTLLMRLTRQATAMKLPSPDYIRAVHSWYEDKLWIFDLLGNAKSARVLEVFKYARQRYGIDLFIIDSMMKLDIAEDDYRGQKAITEQASDFKNEHDCHVIVITHPRKGMDESRLPGKLDVKGTGAITDLADNCFTIWRNKSKHDKLEECHSKHVPPPSEIINQNDALFICDKQRNGEWEGKIPLWFHADSLQYLDYSSQSPHRYVDYSVNPNRG